MNTSLIAMGIAALAVVGLVSGLGLLSLFFGAFDTFVAKPKLTVLKSKHGRNGFAFGFQWNAGKEPARFDRLRLRLFNPFGKPTQFDVSKDFEAADSSFAQDIDFGDNFQIFIKAKGFEEALVQVEIYSSKDGISNQFDMKGAKFRSLMDLAQEDKDAFLGKINKKSFIESPKIVVPEKSFIAPKRTDGVLPQLKIATNPQFAGEFQAAGAGAAAAAGGEAKPNFNITKVWIEPGCIVCNACENIFPEVFEVKADTCIIRPGAPLDNGLRVQEAAEACPVEVIKFAKA